MEATRPGVGRSHGRQRRASTPDGWTATIEIPFTTLNSFHSSDVVWGLNLKRFIRRKNEEDLWSRIPKQLLRITKVSEAGELRASMTSQDSQEDSSL